MTLYEIDSQITDVLARAIDPDTGEIVDETLMQELDRLAMDREKKCENIGCYWKSLRAEADAIKAEEQSLKKRREAIEHRADRMRAYLDYALAGEKLSTARVAVSYRTSKAVIADPEQIPKKYLRRKVTEEPDKKLIKEALDAGKKVKGAYIEEKKNIQIK